MNTVKDLLVQAGLWTLITKHTFSALTIWWSSFLIFLSTYWRVTKWSLLTYLLSYLHNFPSGSSAGRIAYITCLQAAGRISNAVKDARPVPNCEMFTRSVGRLVYASSLVFVPASQPTKARKLLIDSDSVAAAAWSRSIPTWPAIAKLLYPGVRRNRKRIYLSQTKAIYNIQIR